jgi:hypothetical protein
MQLKEKNEVLKARIIELEGICDHKNEELAALEEICAHKEVS